MRRRDKLRLLSWQQRRVLLYACFWLNAIRLALWLFPFGTIRRLLKNVMSVWLYEEAKPVSVDFIVWTVAIAGAYAPGGAKCLARALTTQLLLHRYQHHYQLHIGVAKNAAQVLEAHAWIEYQGRVVVGGLSNLGQFKSLSPAGVGK
ncbi:MAG: lasso peptide biosynthesis B2 protein [Phormidesmis sp.]